MYHAQTQLQALFHAFDKTQEVLQDTDFIKTTEFLNLQSRFNDKKANPDLSIMVYGVYNAGKSTFINALLGQDLAPTGDIPLTSKVDSYRYKNYQILDTPGIDAPKEHEKVADEQLEKADAILFVVNPSGIAEELDTLNKLITLFKKRKKVFLIFNEKTKFSEEDFIKLKNQTRANLQMIALQHGIDSNILEDIPIFKINAKTALKGKIENKQKLVEHSNIHILEKELNAFIDSIVQNNEVYQSLKDSLIDFLKSNATVLQSLSDNTVKKSYDELVTDIHQDKTQLVHQMNHKVERIKHQLVGNLKSWLINEPTSAERNLQQWVERHTELLFKEISHDFESLALKIQSQIEDLQVELPQLNEKIVSEINLNYQQMVDNQESNDEKNFFNEDNINSLLNKINPQTVSSILSGLGTKIQTEHIVLALEITKKYLPTLMKGIGPKTMEKIAGQVMSKYIPLIGPAISVGMSIYDWKQAGNEAMCLQQEIDKQKLAQERYEQQTLDTASQVAEQLETDIKLNLRKAVDDFFNQFIDFISQAKQSFSVQEQENSQLLASLTEIQQGLMSG